MFYKLSISVNQEKPSWRLNKNINDISTLNFAKW